MIRVWLYRSGVEKIAVPFDPLPPIDPSAPSLRSRSNAPATHPRRAAPYLACAVAPSAAWRSTALRNAPSTVTAKL